MDEGGWTVNLNNESEVWWLIILGTALIILILFGFPQVLDWIDGVYVP
jgi:hypothetical protein